MLPKPGLCVSGQLSTDRLPRILRAHILLENSRVERLMSFVGQSFGDKPSYRRRIQSAYSSAPADVQ